MYIHPDSTEHNFVSQFPEIFEKYEPIKFQFKKPDRFNDFLHSSSFLFGSRSNQDISMVFSAVQRSYPLDYVNFESYIQQKDVRPRLLRIWRDSTLRKKLGQIIDEYYEKFGMARSITSFYLIFLEASDRELLKSRIFLPPQLVKGNPQDDNDQIKSRLSLLLDFRNGFVHTATYTPFSDGNRLVPHQKGNQTWFMKLSFDEFYEMTRKALAKFWLQEYENYLKNGGSAEIEKRVKPLLSELEELNKKQMPQSQ